MIVSYTREAQEILQRASQSQDGDLRLLARLGLRQVKKAPRDGFRPARTPRARKGRAS